MPTCLFCTEVLDDTTKPEHVLLNALGGRKTTKTAICSECNNTFGGTIDEALASQVRALRNLLQLESGTGCTAPSMKNVQAGQEKIHMKGDGALELVAKPFRIEQVADGKWNVEITARSEEHLGEIVPHLAAAMKISEESLRTQLLAAKGSLVTRRPGVVHHNFSFGGEEAIRSMVKAALILWSCLVGNDELKGQPYAPAREFVVRGNPQFLVAGTQLDSRHLIHTEKIQAAFGPLFNMINVRSDAAGRVIGHFTLYNAVAWQLVLAESGGIPNAKISLVSNPLDPAQWSDSAADDFDVTFEWLNNPDYSDEMVRSKARFDAIMNRYFEVNTPHEISRITEQCRKAFNVTEGDAVPREKIEEFNLELSRRIALHMAALPSVEEFSPEKKAEIFKKKLD